MLKELSYYKLLVRLLLLLTIPKCLQTLKKTVITLVCILFAYPKDYILSNIFLS